MTICSPSTGNIALGLCPQAILPTSGEQIVMLPSHKGNNCIMLPSHKGNNCVIMPINIFSMLKKILDNDQHCFCFICSQTTIKINK